MTQKDRVIGCLLAGACGDALGVPFEGSSPVAHFQMPDRRLFISDDTQLTLATCEAIVERNGEVDPAAIAAQFAAWHRQSKVTGMGASTAKALNELAHGGHWALVGRKGEMAAGNGAAMRIAPLAFCLDPRAPDSRTAIRDVARITHHNEEAYAGALAVVIAVRAAWDESWAGDSTLIETVADQLPDTNVRDRLTELACASPAPTPEAVAKRLGNSGYVVESVPLALYAAQTWSSEGIITLLRETVALGGDTDTIASMAGQVAGTLLGTEAVPDSLAGLIVDVPLVKAIASRFADVVIGP